MDRENIRAYVNWYCRLRDVQYAAYEEYARRFGLTTNELFVLDIIWFAAEGCSQTDISKRMSTSKQTISAIIKKFMRMGYVTLSESESDRRNKIVRLTDSGMEYARRIIIPAAEAEIDAMGELSEKEIETLVHLTDKLSFNMKNHFENAREPR